MKAGKRAYQIGTRVGVKLAITGSGGVTVNRKVARFETRVGCMGEIGSIELHGGRGRSGTMNGRE